jgi:hypothetical protein
VFGGAAWYSSAPPTQTQLHGSENEGKEGVDGLSETLHNLASLLLTNTTLRQTQQGSTEYGSLTINSR